jgi:hypothetical protein
MKTLAPVPLLMLTLPSSCSSALPAAVACTLSSIFS